jgi:hypothetical protein
MPVAKMRRRTRCDCGGLLRVAWRGGRTCEGVGSPRVSLLAGVSSGKHASPLGLGVSEARAPGDRACIAQVTHFAGLRTEAGY